MNYIILLKNINGNLFYRKDICKKYLSNYEFYGVSIEESKDSLSMIKENILSTYNSNVISNFGSFGGEIRINNNVLVASIDGVGTKVVFAKKFSGEKGFINLGKDIVNHSINDLLVQGAYSFIFLDYYGTNCLNKKNLIILYKEFLIIVKNLVISLYLVVKQQRCLGLQK